MKNHHYEIALKWTGNEGHGTRDYTSYSRNHTLHVRGKYDDVLGATDPAFLGDRTRYNPEELFLSSIAACHMLWYLHLCAVHKIVVTKYTDAAKGVMTETKKGSGSFAEVTLYPRVTITDEKRVEDANFLHREANKMCFIANSCNFKIGHQPQTFVHGMSSR